MIATQKKTNDKAKTMVVRMRSGPFQLYVERNGSMASHSQHRSHLDAMNEARRQGWQVPEWPEN